MKIFSAAPIKEGDAKTIQADVINSLFLIKKRLYFILYLLLLMQHRNAYRHTLSNMSNNNADGFALAKVSEIVNLSKANTF